jgi:hypothetical protein
MASKAQFAALHRNTVKDRNRVTIPRSRPNRRRSFLRRAVEVERRLGVPVNRGAIRVDDWLPAVVGPCAIVFGLIPALWGFSLGIVIFRCRGDADDHVSPSIQEMAPSEVSAVTASLAQSAVQLPPWWFPRLLVRSRALRQMTSVASRGFATRGLWLGAARGRDCSFTCVPIQLRSEASGVSFVFSSPAKEL